MYASAFLEVSVPATVEEEFNNNHIIINALPLVKREIVILLRPQGRSFVRYFNTLNTFIWDLLCNVGRQDLNVTIIPEVGKFKSLEAVHEGFSFDVIIMKDADPAVIERFSAMRQKLSLPPVLFHSLTTILEEFSLDSNCYLLESERPVPKIETIVLGGTFDTFHPGHKLILSLACFYASKRVIIGISDDALLEHKSHKSQIRPYEERLHSVKSFIDGISKGIEVEFTTLLAREGDAASRTDIQGIIVSSETLQGAKRINEIREKNGLLPLAILIVQRNCTSILSSSYLRSLRGHRAGMP